MHHGRAALQCAGPLVHFTQPAVSRPQNWVCRLKRFKLQLDRASAFPEIRKLSGSAKHRAARPFYAATACSIAAAKRSLQAETVQTAIIQGERIFRDQKIERLCNAQGRSSILRRRRPQYHSCKTELQAETVQTAIIQGEHIFRAQKIERLRKAQGRWSIYAAIARSIAAAKRNLQAEAVQTAIGQGERIFRAQKIERLCGVQGRHFTLKCIANREAEDVL